MTTTTIIAGDTANGLVQSAGNDGTLTLQTGPNGGKVNAIALDATGQPTLLKTPNVTTAQSMVRVNTANGYGSTNNVIRRFTNVVTNQGNDITYADSATLGASFTINTSGVYSVSYSDQFNTTQDMGISVNTSAPTTRISSIPVSEILTSAYTAGANLASCASATAYFPAGTVLRAHTYTNASGLNPTLCQFTIARVS